MKAELLSITGLILATLCHGQYVIPQRPPTAIPPIGSHWWSDQQNWPATLTNDNLTYDLWIRLSDEQGTFTASFDEAAESSYAYSASYELATQHILADAVHKPATEYAVSYGPFYGWTDKHALRFKGFRYDTGLQEIHYLTADGAIAVSWYTDYESNYFLILIFGEGKKVVGYAHGPEVLDDGNDRDAEFMLDGQPVSSREFFIHLRKIRSEMQDSGTNTPNQPMQRTRDTREAFLEKSKPAGRVSRVR